MSGDGDNALYDSMMEHGMVMAEKCGVPVLELFDELGLESDPVDILKDAVALFPGMCDSDQGTQFESALAEFKTCSSFDIETIMETVIDAEIGALLECMVAIAPMADQFLAIMEEGGEDTLYELELPELCVESFVGQNPMGDMVRTWGLYPDRIMPCFDALSTSTPPCTLQRWPIPLIGPILQKVTCLVGGLAPLLESVAVETLQSMQNCLPSDMSSNECKDVKMDCATQGFESLMFPKPLNGIPLSDLTIRVASEKGMSDAVQRYDNFLEKCNPTPWKGWSYASGEYSSLAMVGSPASTNSGSNGKGIFLNGMLCGIIVSAVISAAMFLVYRKRHHHQPITKTNKDTNEMSDLNLDENAYSDRDANANSDLDTKPISDAEVI